MEKERRSFPILQLFPRTWFQLGLLEGTTN